ncbi:ras-related protein Rab-3D isoform X1 [Rousettus aegyptiacus]|uniref:ras-related protein Rab-3D isoform X1 n=1 Tax=Rousettus aegyptiacus TaxID=9407 RepID=UPI000786E8B5|nr:ras-related protein Rab-3D isoform X1 [Rousettus aegyptiacus]
MASAGDPLPGPRDAADQNFDYMFKLLLIGNSSVGKTSFLFRYADDSFTPAFVSTVGIDFKVKTVYRHDKRIKLQIWDTAGQERYRTITTAYYRGAMGFLLMYDIANQESFTAVQDWFRVLRGQRQGEHQCKAGLRAPSGYHLREDERVPGTQLQPWKQWEKPDLGRCPTLPVQWLQLLGMVPNPCPPPPTSAWTVTEA